jgi:hypothetical protein
LAIILWVARPSGPIDLRWDGAVYYLLGTSVAHGLGYTIPSEAGSPEAVQYPPLLPAFIALHQLALRTTDFAGCGSVAAKIVRGRLFRIRSRDICHFSEVSPSSICVGCHSDMFCSLRDDFLFRLARCGASVHLTQHVFCTCRWQQFATGAIMIARSELFCARHGRLSAANR